LNYYYKIIYKLCHDNLTLMSKKLYFWPKNVYCKLLLLLTCDICRVLSKRKKMPFNFLFFLRYSFFFAGKSKLNFASATFRNFVIYWAKKNQNLICLYSDQTVILSKGKKPFSKKVRTSRKLKKLLNKNKKPLAHKHYNKSLSN